MGKKMAYLMHIGFDSSARFYYRIYYFEYKGVQYKLIQNNPRKHCDVLLSIVDAYNSQQEHRAYEIASEFLSALSWEHNSRISVWHLGGGGFRDSWNLKRARGNTYDYPHTPCSGNVIGCNISSIPKIETEEQKKALILFREARASNNDYLSFLFYWHILEVGCGDPIGWINRTYKNHQGKIRIISGIEEFPKNKLGEYFYNDCRCAIAHINLRQGKKPIKLENPEDNRRIAISTQVIEEFARIYIIQNLKLNDRLFLYKKDGKGIPIFVSEKDLCEGNYRQAYNMPAQPYICMPKKRWY